MRPLASYLGGLHVHADHELAVFIAQAARLGAVHEQLMPARRESQKLEAAGGIGRGRARADRNDDVGQRLVVQAQHLTRNPGGPLAPGLEPLQKRRFGGRRRGVARSGCMEREETT
jgi:hypothetical protein